MSTLVMDELFPTVIFRQSIYIKKNTDIVHVRPWIYKQGTLTEGDFVCRVYDGATLLSTSTITYTDINDTSTLEYAHGFIRFDFNALVLHRPWDGEDKEYQFEFEMINQSAKDSTNFIAICRAWDGDIYPPKNGAPNSFTSPCGIEIYTHKEKL